MEGPGGGVDAGFVSGFVAGFVSGPVTVEVPATSANLGPGFDCLGLALELTDTLVGEVVANGLEIHVEGEGSGEVRLDESHLVVRAIRAAFATMDLRPMGLRLRCTNRIPHNRGLGSSSAAIVGGIVLARALVEGGLDLLDDAAVLSLATAIEGHPDNVAPALLGGFVISGQAGEEVWAQQSPVDPSVSAVVFVPPHGVRTEVARGLLPETVRHEDAAAVGSRVLMSDGLGEQSARDLGAYSVGRYEHHSGHGRVDRRLLGPDLLTGLTADHEATQQRRRDVVGMPLDRRCQRQHRGVVQQVESTLDEGASEHDATDDGGGG